jgi:hypothetical protein
MTTTKVNTFSEELSAAKMKTILNGTSTDPFLVEKRL